MIAGQTRSYCEQAQNYLNAADFLRATDFMKKQRRFTRLMAISMLIIQSIIPIQFSIGFGAKKAPRAPTTQFESIYS